MYRPGLATLGNEHGLVRLLLEAGAVVQRQEQLAQKEKMQLQLGSFSMVRVPSRAEGLDLFVS